MPRELELLSAASTLRVIGDLGLSVTVGTHDEFRVCLPAIGDLVIADSGVVALDDNSVFISGSLIDFMALLEFQSTGARRLDAYRAAVVKLIQLGNYGAPATTSPAFVESAATAAFQRRLIYNAVMFPLRSGFAASADKMVLEANMESKGVDMRMARRSAIVLEVDDLRRLQSRCRDAGIDVEVPDYARIAYPFFSDVGTLSAVQLEGGKGVPRTLHIAPSRTSFSGLLSVRPGDDIMATSDALLAQAVTTSLRQYNKQAVCLGVMANKTMPQCGWIPPRVTYIVKEDASDFRRPAVLAREGVDVRIVVAQTSGDIFSGITTRWDSFMTGLVLKEIIDKRQLTPRAKLLLESCSPGRDARRTILGGLRANLLGHIADAVEQMLHDGVVVENNQVRIYATEAGYRYHRLSCLDTPPEDMSNFTVTLRNNVTFPEDNNVYHVASIVMAHDEFTAVLMHDDLETTKKLDKAVKTAEMVHNAGKTDGRATPVITDLSVARFLIPYLREITSKLPTEEGVAFLGWNGMKTTFSAPGWQARETDTGVQITDRTSTKHPGVQSLRLYSDMPDGTPVISSDIPHQIADIIAMFCAMVARVYQGYPVKPVAIKNTPAAVAVLKRLFTGIGQLSPLELNSNQRLVQDIPGLKGFPAMAVGYNRQQIRSSGLPLFMIADHGYGLDAADDDVVEMAGRCLLGVLQKTAIHTLRTKGSGFVRAKGLMYEYELVEEGAEVIRQSTGLSAWPVTTAPYSVLRAALSNIPVSDLRLYFMHDLSKQQVYLHDAKLKPHVSRSDLLMELSTMTNMLHDAGTYIVMDAASALEMLQTYYHDTVRLEPVNLPSADAV